jgi:hypothetical protein
MLTGEIKENFFAFKPPLAIKYNKLQEELQEWESAH